MYSSGPSGGISFSAPSYFQRNSVTTFSPSGGINPLDDNKSHTFSRIIGLQYIIVTNTSTNFSFTLPVIGGSNNLNNGYIGAFDTTANYYVPYTPTNCTVTLLTPPSNTLSINQFSVTTSAPDSKTYTFTFSPYTSVLPTIQLNSPQAIGNATIQLNVQYFRYQMQ